MKRWAFTSTPILKTHGSEPSIKCTFGDIDVNLCNRFREYLLNARQLKRPERPVSRNSAAGYWSTFRGLFNIMYRDNLIRTNVNDFLEKIDTNDIIKDYLSVEELWIRREIRLRSIIGYLANEAIILWLITYAAEKSPNRILSR